MGYLANSPPFADEARRRVHPTHTDRTASQRHRYPRSSQEHGHVRGDDPQALLAHLAGAHGRSAWAGEFLGKPCPYLAGLLVIASVARWPRVWRSRSEYGWARRVLGSARIA